MRISDWSSDVCSSDLVLVRHKMTGRISLHRGVRWLCWTMQSGLTGNPINSVARTQNEQEAGSEKADLHDPRLAENGYRQQRPLPRLSGHSARYTNIPIAGVPAIETCPRGPACRETVAETDRKSTRLNSSH